MLLIAVGKLRPGPELALVQRFQSRLRPKLAVREVAEGDGAPREAKRREGEALLAALPANAWAVALDLGGRALTSEGLAQSLERWLGSGRLPTFLIGGAEGLDEQVIARSETILSLGPMTWPHMLVRVMLCEQLYRAQSIVAGHPYHRAGRP